MMWLRTLALLSSVLCVWQLTEGRPPAIPSRHQFNRVHTRGGSSFIQNAKRLYAQRNLQNKMTHKEVPPPREFSSIVNRRRFKTNSKPQSNLRTQSPRASPLIARQRHLQTNAVSQNIPTFGDAIKNIMSGSLEGHIKSDLKNLFPGTPSTTTIVPIVDISLDFGHPVIPNSDINDSYVQEKTIILASPDYTNSEFSEHSASLDAIPNAHILDIPAIVIPDSGFPQPNFPPDFPDYSDVIKSVPSSPSGQGFNDFIIPDSGFPEPNYPPDFPDYSSSIDTISKNTNSASNSPSGQGFNDFIIPDSGFPEPNYPPGFPDYSSSIDTINGNTKSASNNPSGQGFNDFIIPDSGFPEPNYPPDFPDYSSAIDAINGNTKSSSNNPSGQGFNDFIIPDSGFPEPNYPPDFPDYSNSPDYNEKFQNSNAPSQDYNAPSSDYNSPPSSDYPQASAPNPDYPSLDYNLDYPNKEAKGQTIRTQQDLFNLVKTSLIEQLSNRGGSNAPKSIAAIPGLQNRRVNNPGQQNPLEHILSFGQGVVGTASGTGKNLFGIGGQTGKDLFGIGGQVVGVAQDTLGQTIDAVSRAVDEISREILRSIQLIGGELQFIANDSVQAAIDNFQKTTEIATSVGGDFYRASLQVKTLFGKWLSSFVENVGRFVGTAINRTVDGALKQTVSTGQFIGDLKSELIRSIVDNGSSAQQLFERGIENTGQFMSGMGRVTTSLTNSATRSLTGFVFQ